MGVGHSVSLITVIHLRLQCIYKRRMACLLKIRLEGYPKRWQMFQVC